MRGIPGPCTSANVKSTQFDVILQCIAIGGVLHMALRDTQIGYSFRVLRHRAIHRAIYLDEQQYIWTLGITSTPTPLYVMWGVARGVVVFIYFYFS